MRTSFPLPLVALLAAVVPGQTIELRNGEVIVGRVPQESHVHRIRVWLVLLAVLVVAAACHGPGGCH
jgi:hypothetical protein